MKRNVLVNGPKVAFVSLPALVVWGVMTCGQFGVHAHVCCVMCAHPSW